MLGDPDDGQRLALQPEPHKLQLQDLLPVLAGPVGRLRIPAQDEAHCPHQGGQGGPREAAVRAAGAGAAVEGVHGGGTRRRDEGAKPAAPDQTSHYDPALLVVS